MGGAAAQFGGLEVACHRSLEVGEARSHGGWSGLTQEPPEYCSALARLRALLAQPSCPCSLLEGCG